MEKHEGFFDYWGDDETEKIWLELDKLDQEIIYLNSLAAEIGLRLPKSLDLFWYLVLSIFQSADKN